MSRYIPFYKINTHDVDPWDLPEGMSKKEFFTNYIAVKNVEANSLNGVFRNMQGEVWSPNGEAREHIKSLGLAHTSICVGDVIYNLDTDRYFMVVRYGFKELELTE